MTTQSTTEAMTVLTKTYGTQIRQARAIARKLAARKSGVTTRDVRATMEKRGLLTPGEKEFWLGSVFRSPEFVWAGGYKSYSDRARNIHERAVKVWFLAR